MKASSILRTLQRLVLPCLTSRVRFAQVATLNLRGGSGLCRSRAAIWVCATLLCGCAPSDFDKLAVQVFPDDGDGAAVGLARNDAGEPPRKQHGTTGIDAGTVEDVAPDARTPSETGALLDASGPDPEANEGSCDDRAKVAHPLAIGGAFVPLGRLHVPHSIGLRTLGPSAWLGQRGSGSRTWLISSNRVAPTSVKPAGAGTTFPLAAFKGSKEWPEKALDMPWKLDEQSTDLAVGAPMLSLTPEELADGSSLFPTSLIRRSDSAAGGLMFVLRQGPFKPATQVWLAEIEDHAWTATRAAEPLFSTPPLFALGAVQRPNLEYVKVFSCTVASFDPPVNSECVVARVPTAQIAQANAYQVYRGGDDWSRDLTAGVPVLDSVADSLTVSWNTHLKKYLAVHGAPRKSEVLLRVAEQVEGPWSAPVRVTVEPAAMPWVSEVRQHSADQCGKRLKISYWVPTAFDESGVPIAGDTHLGAIDLL